MREKASKQAKFFSEMAQHQIEAREFFGTFLLDSLNRNFGVREALIFFFDTKGNFLSWVDKNGLLAGSDAHPYRNVVDQDKIRNYIYKEAVRDQLTYFNVSPRLYKSTDLIEPDDYDYSAYVKFIEENFHAHYSVTLAYGINAYIQVSVFKSLEQGDFTEQEMKGLSNLYVYVANAYKNFKKHEQIKIVSRIQNDIIASGEKAYLVTDDFMHLMSFNSVASEYLKDILGDEEEIEVSCTKTRNWIPDLLSGMDEELSSQNQIRVIKNYVLKRTIYDQSYSNGIVDRYYCISISKREESEAAKLYVSNCELTQAEQRVAELLYGGLTYKEISVELGISYHTVKKHVQNIYVKCGVNSRYELCKWLEGK